MKKNTNIYFLICCYVCFFVLGACTKQETLTVDETNIKVNTNITGENTNTDIQIGKENTKIIQEKEVGEENTKIIQEKEVGEEVLEEENIIFKRNSIPINDSIPTMSSSELDINQEETTIIEKVVDFVQDVIQFITQEPSEVIPSSTTPISSTDIIATDTPKNILPEVIKEEKIIEEEKIVEEEKIIEEEKTVVEKIVEGLGTIVDTVVETISNIVDGISNIISGDNEDIDSEIIGDPIENIETPVMNSETPAVIPNFTGSLSGSGEQEIPTDGIIIDNPLLNPETNTGSTIPPIIPIPDEIDQEAGIAQFSQGNFSRLVKFPVTNLSTSANTPIILYQFELGDKVQSPFLLVGKIQKRFVYDGLFSIKILNNDGVKLKDWYATTFFSNDEGDAESGMVYFLVELVLNEDVLGGAESGYLRFTSDNTELPVEERDFIDIPVTF